MTEHDLSYRFDRIQTYLITQKNALLEREKAIEIININVVKISEQMNNLKEENAKLKEENESLKERDTRIKRRRNESNKGS